MNYIGMTLEGLCCFGVYRLMAEQTPHYAHCYRSGIFGYVIFGVCGYHVPVCAMVFLQKHGLAEELLLRYGAYFVLPSQVLYLFHAVWHTGVSCCPAVRK